MNPMDRVDRVLTVLLILAVAFVAMSWVSAPGQLDFPWPRHISGAWALGLLLALGVVWALWFRRGGITYALVIAALIASFVAPQTAEATSTPKPIAVQCLAQFHPNNNGGCSPNTSGPNAFVQKTPEQCDGYNIVVDPHTSDKQISAGVDGGSPEALSKILDVAKHDPSYLQAAHAVAFNDNPAVDLNTIAANGCYTALGRDMWNQVYGVVKDKDTKIEQAQAPATGANFGTAPGGGNFQTVGAISGNRAAYQITTPSGHVFWVMKRCGNFVRAVAVPSIPARQVTVPATPVITVTQQQFQQQQQTTTVIIKNKPPTTNTTTPTPTVPPSPPTTIKCPPGVNNDGHGHCGNDSVGPHIQTQPSSQGPTPGYTQGNGPAVSNQQQPSNNTPSANAGNSSTPKGIDSGSHNNNSNVPAGGDNGGSQGSSSGISQPPTPAPDPGQTSGAPACDPSNC